MERINVFQSLEDATVADVDSQLHAVRDEQAAITARQSELEALIADAYGGDTELLEVEYVRLTSRVKALEQINARLATDKRAAFIRELVAEIEVVFSQAKEAERAAEALKTEIATLQAELQVKRTLYQEQHDLAVGARLIEMEVSLRVDAAGYDRLTTIPEIEAAIQPLRNKYQKES